MSDPMLRGRKEIMAALKICDVKTFYDVKPHLPIFKRKGMLVANRDDLIRAYLDLARRETEGLPSK